VGAVVVHRQNDGHHIIVGEGTTADGGRPHAETQALAMAGALASGATLYVSLEPCSHEGQTPPCTQAILNAGIGRVVCGLEDPDPRVAGSGFAVLNAHGITVDFVQAPSALLVAGGHILRVRYQRPLVQLKCAVSGNGLIAPGTGKPVWVTGPEARAHGHLLRARSDAILVGRGTIAADDPLLTCRLPGLADRSPVPVILDSGFTTVPGSQLFNDKGRSLIVFVAAGADVVPEKCIPVPCSADGRLDPGEILRQLACKGVTRLLIEGGPTVAGSFMKANLVDEIIVYQGSNALQGDGLLPFGSFALERLVGDTNWQPVSSLKLGGDQMTHYRRRTLISDLSAQADKNTGS
jgi:diaminohydroxyphosphoribosylaminopyrimidine deaminase/5-amino-6-(5-phosphoribosylamino)uracil reductase